MGSGSEYILKIKPNGHSDGLEKTFFFFEEGQGRIEIGNRLEIKINS